MGDAEAQRTGVVGLPEGFFKESKANRLRFVLSLVKQNVDPARDNLRSSLNHNLAAA